MAGQNYYYITSLPPLDNLDGPAPLDLGRLVEFLRGAGDALDTVNAVILSDDLLQRQAMLAGEIDHCDPTVLTPAQAANQEPLPDYLQADSPASGSQARLADSVWDAYYRHAAATAKEAGNALLAGWVAHEVALRNAVASRRARALDLNVDDYLVAEDLADRNCDFRATLNEWASAADPLAGARVLDTERWSWLNEQDRPYSFADEELTAYAAKLVLIRRWQRLSQGQDTAEPLTAQQRNLT